MIYALLLLGGMCASRASFRLLSEFVQRRHVGATRCVIYGTGTASLATIREAFGDLPLRIVGFIDDDPQNRRLRFGGYSVLGDFESLLKMIQDNKVDSVVLNTRIMDVERLNILERVCKDFEVELLRLQVQVKPFVAAS